MKRSFWLAAILLLCGCLMAAPTAGSVKQPVQAEAAQTQPVVKSTPGVEAAQALSTLTGVAISPLLGVGAVGAWKYFSTPQANRSRLPWFAHPWFWIPALSLVSLVFLKDSLGATMPTSLKKPFDVLEFFENKVSGLVAAGAFVPLIVTIFHSAGAENQLSTMGLAMIDLSSVFNLLLVPVALAIFIVVWLAGHAINALILLSPFSTVDAALKLFRFFVLLSVMFTSFLNVYLGAVWAVLIIILSYFIAGWSLRLSVFGTQFAYDLITFRSRRFKLKPVSNWMFTARKIEKVPIRTLGRLEKDAQGTLVFHYRPWLVLPKRILVLPQAQYFVGRGLIYPEVWRASNQQVEAVLAMPPRYRNHEEEVAQHYGMGPVQEVGLLRGINEIRRWIRDLFKGEVRNAS